MNSTAKKNTSARQCYKYGSLPCDTSCEWCVYKERDYENERPTKAMQNCVNFTADLKYSAVRTRSCIDILICFHRPTQLSFYFYWKLLMSYSGKLDITKKAGWN